MAVRSTSVGPHIAPWNMTAVQRHILTFFHFEEDYELPNVGWHKQTQARFRCFLLHTCDVLHVARRLCNIVVVTVLIDLNVAGMSIMSLTCIDFAVLLHRNWSSLPTSKMQILQPFNEDSRRWSFVSEAEAKSANLTRNAYRCRKGQSSIDKPGILVLSWPLYWLIKITKLCASTCFMNFLQEILQSLHGLLRAMTVEQRERSFRQLFSQQQRLRLEALLQVRSTFWIGTS